MSPVAGRVSLLFPILKFFRQQMFLPPQLWTTVVQSQATMGITHFPDALWTRLFLSFINPHFAWVVVDIHRDSAKEPVIKHHIRTALMIVHMNMHSFVSFPHRDTSTQGGLLELSLSYINMDSTRGYTFYQYLSHKSIIGGGDRTDQRDTIF